MDELRCDISHQYHSHDDDPPRSEPGAEGLRDDAGIPRCPHGAPAWACYATGSGINPNAVTPAADSRDYWQRRALDAEEQVRIRDATPAAEGLLDAVRAYGDARADVAYGRATRKAIDLAWDRLLTVAHIPPMDQRDAATPPAEGLDVERLQRIEGLARDLVDAYADNTIAGTQRLGQVYMALVVALTDPDPAPEGPSLWGPDGPKAGQIHEVAGVGMRWTGSYWERIT